MADDAILVERLLRVIDEGRRTATYKLALLLGLIDAVALSPGQAVIPTRLVAERVAFLYYPRTRAFVAAGGIERSDPDRTSALVRTTYSHVVAGTPLWRRGREFDLARGPIVA